MCIYRIMLIAALCAPSSIIVCAETKEFKAKAEMSAQAKKKHADIKPRKGRKAISQRENVAPYFYSSDKKRAYDRVVRLIKERKAKSAQEALRIIKQHGFRGDTMGEYGTLYQIAYYEGGQEGSAADEQQFKLSETRRWQALYFYLRETCPDQKIVAFREYEGLPPEPGNEAEVAGEVPIQKWDEVAEVADEVQVLKLD